MWGGGVGKGSCGAESRFKTVYKMILLLERLTSEKNLYKLKIRALMIRNWLHIDRIHHSFNSFSSPHHHYTPPPLITTYEVLDLRECQISLVYILGILHGLGIK